MSGGDIRISRHHSAPEGGNGAAVAKLFSADKHEDRVEHVMTTTDSMGF